MKIKVCGKWAAAVAALGMSLPTAAFATTPAATSNDVALRNGGVLVGQVLDQQGVAKANTVVSVQYANHEIVRTTTDANGVFAAKGLRGGEYQLLTQDGSSSCRLWAAETAPPSAQKAALVVTGGDVVRGQGHASGWVRWMKAHPYITAGYRHRHRSAVGCRQRRLGSRFLIEPRSENLDCRPRRLSRFRGSNAASKRVSRRGRSHSHCHPGRSSHWAVSITRLPPQKASHPPL